MMLAKVIKSLVATCTYCSRIIEAVKQCVSTILHLVARSFVSFTRSEDVDEVI
jgi:hypothetical protein